jgi:drug/metabolite transporter (DMT)-like permease
VEDSVTINPKPKARSTWRVHAALVIVQVSFGGFHVVGKAVLAHLDPLALAGFRVLLATPILFLLAWQVERARPARRDLLVLAALGFLGVFLNQLLFITGLKYTTATNAGIIQPSIPVFTAAIAALLGVERLSRRQGAGIAVAVLGALVMLNPLRFHLGSQVLLGNLLLLLNSVAFAGYLVLQRPVLRRIPPLTVTAWVFLFGGLGVLLVSAPTMMRVPFADEPAVVWWGLAYVVIVPSVLAYALNMWAVGRSSPSTAAAYVSLQPAVAGALAAIFLGERAGLREAAGFALIITGLILVSQGLRRNGRATKAEA